MMKIHKLFVTKILKEFETTNNNDLVFSHWRKFFNSQLGIAQPQIGMMASTFLEWLQINVVAIWPPKRHYFVCGKTIFIPDSALGKSRPTDSFVY